MDIFLSDNLNHRETELKMKSGVRLLTLKCRLVCL